MLTTLVLRPLEVKAMHNAVLCFIGVAQDVAKIKADEGTEVLYSIGVPIGHDRFDRVLDLPPGQRAGKGFGQRRRANFPAGLESSPVCPLKLLDRSHEATKHLLAVKPS